VSVLLGIDLGERRIGVAWADTGSGAVQPLLTLRRGSAAHDAAVIERLCAERGAEAVVVGLPLHLDGRESEQARRTRDWVAAVEAHLSVPLRLRDERLSSADAEAAMGRPPRGHAGGPPSAAARQAWRARVDREAAARILMGELDSQTATGARS
jgi:putative holliday junction resolvase